MTAPMTHPICERLREEAEAFGGSRFEDDDGNVLAALFNEAAATIESHAARIAALEEALEEAMRRYPDARNALAWFAAASGLSAGEVTQEVTDWAKATLAQRETP